MLHTLWLTQAALGSVPGLLTADETDALTERIEQTVGPVTWVTPTDRAPVVNGSPVPAGNDQVVALAGLDPTTGTAMVFCSGSLIHDSWVLTAAHCIDGSRDISAYGLQLNVLWGTDVNTGYTDAIPWATSAADPSYNSSQFINDAGLVELSTPKSDVKWMVLNDEVVDQTWIGTELEFFGYGVTQDYGSGEGVQRTTVIPIVEVDAFNLMTFGSGTNVCSGDSGGPSTFDGPDGPEQIGINAFVTPGCVGGQAGSTRVDNHIDWIRSYVPEAATSYAELPQDEVVGEGGDGRHWLDDLGVDDEISGIAGLDDAEGVGATGCDLARTGWTWGGAVLLGLALVRRRT